MADRILPAPTTERFDLAAWLGANVQAGDVVHAQENAVYWTEGTKLVDAPPFTFQGHGATLLAKSPPINKVWNRLFALTGKTVGVQVFDLNVRGPRSVGDGYNPAYEGQHGFAFDLGVRDSLICRCSSAGVWGDHVYIAGAVNTIVCQLDASSESGRHGVAAVHGEDILIYGSKIHGLRTAFNLEVHPNKKTLRYTVDSCEARWKLRTITGTGSGEASDITFKNIKLLGRLNAEVYGIGSPGRSGVRRNWVLHGFTGPQPDATPVSRFHDVDGLSITDVPYPCTTTGSTAILAAAS
jgi:hypothetical protein